MLKPQRLLLPLLLALTPAFVAACGSEPPAAEPSTTEATSEPTDAPAGDDASAAGKYLVATAKKQGTIQVYADASEAKKQQTVPSPRLTDTEPKMPVDLIMLVKDQKPGWLQVTLPVRPNGTTGWVKEEDFSVKSHDYRIEATLGAYKLKAFKGDQEIFDAPIGVATEDSPTPGGQYYTTELIETPDPKGAYGPYALGLSGFSEVHKTFGKGETGQLGIHGTNEPQKIGSKVSHGCIRLKNPDIERLVKLNMPIGTPVIINA